MNKIISALFFLLSVYNAAAQKVYFVYLQTEDRQPFFVRLNEKVHSSTASGYLILSKLRDSSYNLKLGFPGNAIQEQNFSVTIGQKDHGYLVKQFGEKGWGLFNLQTLSVQMSVTAKPVSQEKPKTDGKDVSAFTDILSKAADDPSLKEKPVSPDPPAVEKKVPVVSIAPPVIKEDVKVEKKDTAVIKPDIPTPTAVVSKDNTPVEVKEPLVKAKPDSVIENVVSKKEEPVVISKEKEPTVTAKPDSVIENIVAKKEEQVAVSKEKEPPVTAKPDSVTENAVAKKEEPPVELKEKEPVKEDTVIAAKPVPVKEEPAKETNDPAAVNEEYKKSIITKRSESSTTEGFGLVFIDQYENGVTDTIRLLIPNQKTAVIPVNEEIKEEKKFLDISTDTVKKVAENVVSPVIPSGNEQPVVTAAVKNNCSGIATESDFLKLRKKMAAADTDEEMLTEAKKYFKLKCFTVLQMKNLSALFLNDTGKYNFFDAGYLFASDVENYSSLQAELKDDYYINRFKAMLRN